MEQGRERRGGGLACLKDVLFHLGRAWSDSAMGRCQTRRGSITGIFFFKLTALGDFLHL